MARYLPRDYEPIPDALLYSRADLIDVTRRIARNQNWIWANHGAVFAACGQEPMTTQTATVTGAASLDLAYFAAPLRSATGSDSLRVYGLIDITGNVTTVNTTIRLYQLLPGETEPTADTPYDDWNRSVSGFSYNEGTFEIVARVRSGADPMRMLLRVFNAGTATATVRTVTATWTRSPASVLGETVAPWQAISQFYVWPDRATSAALLRALSNRTLRLLAESPKPIFTHSFFWPRISTAAAGVWTKVAHYVVNHDAITVAPRLRFALQYLLTGQDAQVEFRITDGFIALAGPQAVSGTALADGVYKLEGTWAPVSAMGIAAGDFHLWVEARCTVGATAPPAYCTNVGAVVLGFRAWEDTRDRVDLGLPGAETIPAAYVPLDDNACAPASRVVERDDRIGRRAGPYYLVKNLIWLAANRTGHTLIADWLHRSQSAGYSGVAGDGYYRDGSILVSNAPYPTALDRVGWADRANPTNWGPIGSGGHHYKGDVLGRFYCTPLNGGRIGGLLRPDLLYITGAPGRSDAAEITAYAPGGVYGAAAWREAVRGGVLGLGPMPPPLAAGDTISLRARAPASSAGWSKDGMQIALHSAYIYELPLTQDDLNALP